MDRKPNPFTSFWKKIFVYSGDATVAEYIVGLIMLVAMSVLCFASALLMMCQSFGGKLGGNEVLFVIGKTLTFVFAVLYVAVALGFVSVTVRRLHFVAKNGGWAALLIIAGIALIVLTFICSGCSTNLAFEFRYWEQPYSNIFPVV